MAERLKGLLDSARLKIGGLLGDAPKEFAVGAVSGVPGLVGDMAYGLGTGLMNTPGGQFAQWVSNDVLGIPLAMPESVDFPGTSDYLANKAGYAPPTTASGKVGRFVGSILSPGPGELSTVAHAATDIAPWLAAIPFWHGSPHKFDAFDLSHMGKGEGAQAYGWGAYGAESPEVAKQYLNVDPSVPVPPRRQFMGQDLEPGTPEYHAARLASEGKESLAGLRKLVAGWISDARPGEPTDGYQKTLEILNQAQKKSDFKQLKPEPYLYRGEYRWPDPAKEAATPLTGEDLLQWDRPISEQPESVRRAVSELGIVGGNMELPAGGLDMSGGGRILDNRDGKVKPGSVAPYVLVSGDAKFDISEKDLQRMLGGSDDPTGEQIYTRLTAKLGDQNAASKALDALGAPGIRYLDGMSRDGGQGTYNYVMFDDKGIKLLERNGSPLQASNVRFDDSKTWYHTTTEDFTEFDPSKGSKTAAFGPGIYVSEDVNDSARWAKSKEGARTIAVQLAPEHILSGPLSEQQAQQLSEYLGREVKAGDPIPYLSLERRGGTVSEGAKAAGFAGVEHYGSGAGANAKNIVITDPTQVKIIDHGRNGSPIEDFAARRAGKAKPYKEAMGDEQARTLQDIVGQYEAQGLKLDAFQNSSNPDVVTLSRIQVPEAQRGQGIGSQAMADLVRYADEQGKTIALSPSTDFGASSVARLRDFYKRFGFVDNAGRSKDYELSESMYRRPGAQ